MTTQNRLSRMISWLEANPYKFYPHYDDQLSEEQIELLIEGKFDAFDETWFDYEWRVSEYADWDHIESDFIKRFNLPKMKAAWPLDVQHTFKDHRVIDVSEVIDHCLRKTRTKVSVKPVKQSGNYIEFPNYDFDKAYNHYLCRYNKKYLGINNSWDAETCYYFDVLTVIGKIDWLEWYRKRRLPDFFKFGPSDFCLSHNFINGSGGLGDVEPTVERKMRFEIRNDESSRYGVQAVFGFIERCWSNELTFIWS